MLFFAKKKGMVNILIVMLEQKKILIDKKNILKENIKFWRIYIHFFNKILTN